MTGVRPFSTRPVFTIGDLVRIREGDWPEPSPSAAVTSIYQIVALLPGAEGRIRYCVMGGADWHERAVHESQLVHASRVWRQQSERSAMAMG